MFDFLSLIFGLALAAEPSPKPELPPAAVMPECNALFRGHKTALKDPGGYADHAGYRHFICVDGVWVEQDKSIQPTNPRPP